MATPRVHHDYHIIDRHIERCVVCEILTLPILWLARRLNPLKTEDVKMVVGVQSVGASTIKPRISYIDETGKYQSHEPELVTMTVKELGIRGWVKGER